MNDLRQRTPRCEDARHLAYVRKQPCCIPNCRRGNIEAAHIRMRRADMSKDVGMGEKPHDMYTVPLCNHHHQSGPQAQHKITEQRFWFELHKLDPFAIALQLWHESGAEARSHMPKRVKAERKIPDRKPREQRKKIQAGRKLQSNPVIRSRGFEKREARP